LKKSTIITGLVILVLLVGFSLILRKCARDAAPDGKDRTEQSDTSGSGDRPSGGIFGSIGSLSSDESSAKERIRRRTLTPEEKLENEREFARMREKIPGNMFIPGELSEEERKEQGKFMKDMILLGNKVRKGTATKEETRKYYEMKTREVEDKIEFVRYILDRVEEKSRETGKQYLDEKTLSGSEEDIRKLEKELKTYQDKLESL
jgi:hypothetical protein